MRWTQRRLCREVLNVPPRPYFSQLSSRTSDYLSPVPLAAMAMPGPDHPLLVSVPLVDPVVTRKVGLIRRRGRSLSPAAQQLFDLFGEVKGWRRGRPST